MANTAYIGVGSNMGSPRENCERAIGLLQAHPKITLTAPSSFFETEPVGVKEQDWFVNAAVEIQTSLQPRQLLEELLRIEKTMGRVRKKKWGPRLIDLDLLLYDDRILNEDNLQVPHPEMVHRGFVLVPLAEIAGDRVHPVLGKTIHQLLHHLKEDFQVQRIPPSPGIL